MSNGQDQEKSHSMATEEPNASVDMNQTPNDNIDKSLKSINSNENGSNGDNQNVNTVTNESEEHKSHSEELSTRNVPSNGEHLSQLSDSQKLNTEDNFAPQNNNENQNNSDNKGLNQTGSLGGNSTEELKNEKTESDENLLNQTESSADIVNDNGESSTKSDKDNKEEVEISQTNKDECDQLTDKEIEEPNTFLTHLPSDNGTSDTADKNHDIENNDIKSQEHLTESTPESVREESAPDKDNFYDDPSQTSEPCTKVEESEKERTEQINKTDKEETGVKAEYLTTGQHQPPAEPTDEVDGNAGEVVDSIKLPEQSEEKENIKEEIKQPEPEHQELVKDTPVAPETREEDRKEGSLSEQVEEVNKIQTTQEMERDNRKEGSVSVNSREEKESSKKSTLSEAENDNSASSSTKQDDTLADVDPLETIAESSPKQEIKTEGMESEVNKSEVEKSADDIALADDVPKRGATDDTDNEADDLKSEEIVQTKESKNDTDDETNKEKEELNEDDSGGKDVEKDDGQNETETNEDNEKPSDHDRGENENEEKVYESEKLDPVVEEEKKSNEAEILPQEEEPPREKTPEPEPIKITRNIDIDNAVTVIEDTEGSLKDLLNDMKELLTNYQDRVNSQSLSDFTNDLDKFRGDFESLKDAFKYSEELFHYLNKTLKDLRMLGDNMNSLIQKKFRMEDLTVWLESPEERLEEKEKLKEERIAVEKSAMAKAAEARAAIARAAVGVTESSLYAAEVEAEAAEAEGVAMRAWESAQNARRDMEEAEKAAVEKRKAEEEARKRAEERAQKKAEEERLRQEEENKRLQEEAEKKGTSFEDEKRQFLEEKARKEEARKNPKNWPRYIYSIESANLDQGVPGCVIRAIEGSMTRDDVTVTAVDQLSGTLTLVENEELISNIILIKSTDPEKKFQFEEPVAVAIPHCLQRNIPGREPVIKQLQPNGRWAELPTNDVIIEDIRELKFVEIRTRRFGVFAVVLRLKKDTLAFMRRGNKVNSTVDARITFTCKPGTFKNNVCFTSEVQTLDVNTVTDLNKRYPTECGSLLSSSPILRFQIPNRKFAKPLTLTLPLPPNTVKQKRPQSVAPGSLNREKMDQREQAPARPVSSMGFTPKEDEPEEESHLIVRDDKGPWMVLPKVNLVQPKNKDIVTFDIKEPHDRFILVKTKQGVSPLSIEKIANHVEKAIHHRTMHVILRQRSDDPNEIVMMCCPASKTEKIIKKLGEEGFDEGPPPSKDIIVKEGQILTVGFRGNIQCDNDDDIKMVFNTFIRGRKEFSVEEIDKFAQKSFPFYRGFAQVFTKVMVQRPVVAADKAKAPQKPGAMEWVEEDVLLTELLINIPKPEPEPPKPLATAPIRVSAEGPNKEDVLQFVAGELGDEWKKLAQYLCLKSVRIQAILRQNNQNPDPKKIRYDMLVTWAKRVPRCLNKLEILAQALNACGRGDLAAELRDRDEEFRRRRALAFRDSYLRRAFVKVAQNPEAVKGWKTIASRLGVSSDDVNEIDQSAPSIQQKCFSSLQRWQKSVGDEATLPILSEKLRVCKYRQLARDIETIS